MMDSQPPDPGEHVGSLAVQGDDEEGLFRLTTIDERVALFMTMSGSRAWS